MAEQSIKWYDDLPEAERKLRAPRLTATQLEVLTQMRKTTWDGYVISKAARDELVNLGLVTRCNGWQVVTREGMAVLDTYGLMADDRWGATTDRPNFMPMLTPMVWERLRKKGLIR